MTVIWVPSNTLSSLHSQQRLGVMDTCFEVDAILWYLTFRVCLCLVCDSTGKELGNSLMKSKEFWCWPLVIDRRYIHKLLSMILAQTYLIESISTWFPYNFKLSINQNIIFFFRACFSRLWREASCVCNQGTWYAVAFLDLNLLSADFFNLIALGELALTRNSHSLFVVIIWLCLSLQLYQMGWRNSEIHKRLLKRYSQREEMRCTEREDLGGGKQKPAKTRCQSITKHFCITRFNINM